MEGTGMSVRPGYRVRQMGSADADAVWSLARRVPEAAQWPRADFGRAAENAFDSWVAERNALIVGFLISRRMAEEAEVLNLAIEAEHRRRGLARAMLDAALEEARRAGARQAFLEVRASNTPAIAFYETAGFQVMRRRKDYYNEPQEDALVMAFLLE